MPTSIVSAIHEHGGDVLKLIGDGTLAIFTAENRERRLQRRARRGDRARAKASPGSTSGAAATACR